jgi:hypothetical protein
MTTRQEPDEDEIDSSYSDIEWTAEEEEEFLRIINDENDDGFGATT